MYWECYVSFTSMEWVRSKVSTVRCRNVLIAASRSLCAEQTGAGFSRILCTWSRFVLSSEPTDRNASCYNNVNTNLTRSSRTCGRPYKQTPIPSASIRAVHCLFKVSLSHRPAHDLRMEQAYKCTSLYTLFQPRNFGLTLLNKWTWCP